MKNKEIPETNLEGLIRKIKTEGIQEADKKSAEIIQESEKKASEIRNAAEQEAETIIRKAEEEIKEREKIGREALQQAARDIILNIRESLIDSFDALLKKECRKIFPPETIEKILFEIIKEWQKGEDGAIEFEVVVSEADRKALSDFFLSKLQKKIRSGIELKTHPDIAAGFRIGIKGEHLYYDFTDESIAEVLAAYLNPQLSLLVNNFKKLEKKE